MARRKKRSVWQGVPYAIAMLAGAIIVSQVDNIQSPWHLAIPWALSAIFFVLWRLEAHKKTIRASHEESKRPRVKRYV